MNHFFQLINTCLAQTTIQQIPATFSINDLIMRVINWAFVLGGGIAVIYVVYAGMTYLTAGANSEQAETAKTTITYAVIGIIVIAMAFTIVNWLAAALDFAQPVNF